MPLDPELPPTTTGAGGQADGGESAPDEAIYTADLDQQDLDDATDGVVGDPAPPDAPDSPEPPGLEPPPNVVTDAEGRWRNPDGTFASRQPNAQAVASVKAETAPVVQPNTPWTPRIYDSEREIIPGALRSPTGDVFIPANQVGQLTALVARGDKYAEIPQMRQQFAQREQQLSGRLQFEGEKYGEILKNTLLNPDFLQRASQDPATAIREVRLMVQEAALESREQFGVLPQTTEAQGTDMGGGLDQYEGVGAVHGLLDEIFQSPDYHGVLKDSDREAIINDLRATDVPLFVFDPNQGWLLDERPIRLATKLHGDRVRAMRPNPPADAANRRNAAALPPTTAPAANKPKAAAASEDKYRDKPWDNPALSFNERKKAFHKAKGFTFPGEG